MVVSRAVWPARLVQRMVLKYSRTPDPSLISLARPFTSDLVKSLASETNPSCGNDITQTIQDSPRFCKYVPSCSLIARHAVSVKKREWADSIF